VGFDGSREVRIFPVVTPDFDGELGLFIAVSPLSVLVSRPAVGTDGFHSCLQVTTEFWWFEIKSSVEWSPARDTCMFEAAVVISVDVDEVVLPLN
jgi:hypothetical protein